MKNILLCSAIVLAFFSSLGLHAQVDPENKPYTYKEDSLDVAEKEKLKQTVIKEIEALERQKALYESNQRTDLAEKIVKINERLKQDANYSAAMADADKKALAAEYAQRIQTHNEMIDGLIEFTKIRKKEGERNSNITVTMGNGFNIELEANQRKLQKEIKTTSGFSLGFGYNFMNGDQLGIDDFSYGNNNYVSFGIQYQTALSTNQKLRFNYGLMYQSHGAELNGGRIFSPNTDDTQITSIGFAVDKAKFRQDQLIVPLQLEFGGTDKKEYDDGRVRYQQGDHWKAGIGGFVGVNMSSRLKLKYEENGREIKNTIVDAFENEVLVYGLDAYIGKGSTTLFGRMNLNNVFQSGSVDAQYVSFGIRFQ
ncbi:hypothetical protein [Nonlabens xiamenensis]|uniref:hypothetical protein n=1 Tax=Nonlabens xiamenensis TaxID=2341043 RepID=UPI000F6126A9|nr:hypothetical protein [Nonlabens xiamenensis]